MKKYATLETVIKETQEIMKKDKLSGADYGKIDLLTNCVSYCKKLKINNPIKQGNILNGINSDEMLECEKFLFDNAIDVDNMNTALTDGRMTITDLNEFITFINVVGEVYNRTSKLNHNLLILNDNGNRIYTLLNTYSATMQTIIKVYNLNLTKKQAFETIEDLIKVSPYVLLTNSKEDVIQTLNNNIHKMTNTFNYIRAYNSYIELLSEATQLKSLGVYLFLIDEIKEMTIDAINFAAKNLIEILQKAVDSGANEQDTLKAVNKYITAKPIKYKKTLNRNNKAAAQDLIKMALDTTTKNNSRYLDKAFDLLFMGYDFNRR